MWRKGYKHWMTNQNKREKIINNKTATDFIDLVAFIYCFTNIIHTIIFIEQNMKVAKWFKSVVISIVYDFLSLTLIGHSMFVTISSRHCHTI